MTSEVERAIAALSGDPLLAASHGGAAPVLVWDAAISHVMYASEAAGPARALAADPDGRVTLAGPALTRLRELAAGLATSDRFRLELLRFGADRLSPATMLACRRLDLADGPVLMTVVVGGMPGARGPGRPDPRSETTPDEPAAIAPGPGAEPVTVEPAESAAAESGPGRLADGFDPPLDAPPQDAPRIDVVRRDATDETHARRPSDAPRRFVWIADREGRVTAVSPGLAAAVGPAHAEIVGRSWAELSGPILVDPSGEVVRRIAAGEAWRGLEVAWRIGEPGYAAPVTLGGIPVRAPDGRIEGFRGSGFVRLAEAAPLDAVGAPQPAVPETAEPQPAGPDMMSLSAEIEAQLGGARAAPPELADPEPEPDPAILSFAERGALHEIARALGARVAGEGGEAPDPGRVAAEVVPLPSVRGREVDPLQILDRTPVGIAVLRGETPIFVNAHLLGLLGDADLAEIVARGAASALAVDPRAPERRDGAAATILTTRSGARVTVEAAWSEIAWGDLPAVLVTIRERAGADAAAEADAVRLDLAAERAQAAALADALDLAGIGTATLDGSGRILSLSRSAERLFGYDQREVAGEDVAVLIAPGSHRDLADLLAGASGARDPADAQERRLLARLRDGREAPLLARAGPTGAGATLAWREAGPVADPGAAEPGAAEPVSADGAASGRHAQFLARISHEIRTPVNAIVGFAELMLEERYGPIDNERYRTYLRDIQRSGETVVTLVGDLMNLAQVAAGQGELVFRSLDLNHVVAESVASIQPSASRERVVVRTSLGPNLPRVVADERSIRQIALNLLANAIRFTGPGGQVIVSTARTDRGEMAFRVRDTGSGMTSAELDAALQPFARMAETRRGDVSELGLPLSKALAEANHASFSIASGRRNGTLVEVVFPPARKAAE